MTKLTNIADADTASGENDFHNAGFKTEAEENSSGTKGNFQQATEGNFALLKRNENDDGDILDFDIAAIDGLGGNGIGVGYKKVNSITDLPTYCKNGFTIKISGSADSVSDDYWVKFETTNNNPIGDGVWVETVCPNVSTHISESSLPLVLENSAENVFDCKTMSVAHRKVGDDTTNPFPSFMGKQLNNIFLYKDRLGFLCEDKIIMTESGLGLNENGVLRYNFFKTTVTTDLDTDPIDITVSTGRVTNLKDVVGFQENLIIFSENGQFGLRGGDLLSPNNVSISSITNFEFEQNVKPLALGSYIYFPFQRGDFAGVREFTVNSTTDNYDAQEITEHTPSYIPSDIESLVGSTSEDIIIAFAPSTPKFLYVYKYFWSGTKKVLSSWSKFTLPFDVRGCEVFEGTLYLIGVHGGKTLLVDMPLQSGLVDAGSTYNTYLDLRKEHELTAGNKLLGFQTDLPVVVYDDNFNLVKKVDADDNRIGVTITDGDISSANGTKLYTGILYTMKYQFSEQVFKQPTGGSKAPSGFTAAQIRNGSIFFNNSRGFDIKVKADNRDEKTFTYSPIVIGTSSIGSTGLISGNFRFPVFTDAYGTLITIENANALPSNFSSAEFEMFVHERSRRFG